MSWRAQAGRALALAALLVSAALAHHPEHLRVSELAVLDTAEGAFLQMRVDLEGGPLRLRSVVVDGESARLEHHQAEGAGAVEGVMIGEGVQRFGADTVYRIRLHDTVLVERGFGDRLTVTALLEPGFLISQEIRVGTLPLLWLLVGGFLMVALASWPLARTLAARRRAA